MTSERIETLEIALAHAEATIDDLSTEVRRQGLEIDGLRKEIGKLTRSLETLAASDEDAPAADQRPPHW